ncbi:MAG TPA: suppressor of fused domain protein [Puia sp.]|uniref:suppressor of fused domain protein n=1 Tax=Puia sp. TaxID=2045100 RepID=UPI002CBFE393|nr:suppressor of fused domain protein [Puia sp.]HVU97689.1 suppressor of fused domain protein [Puia sp.]
MNFFRMLFKRKKPELLRENNWSQEEWEQHYELKSAGLERVLGASHPMVGHAIIPFEVGGAVDMYYYPNGIPGTGFATMELLQPDGSGPIPNRMGTYELVGFTKLDYIQSETETPFSRIERRMCGIFTSIGFYSMQAKLEPGETCEIPRDNQPNTCLVFDEYAPDGKEFYIGDQKHGLLLVTELFPEEMQYARNHGSQFLLEKLKAAGHYPYSDMDREPVV